MVMATTKLKAQTKGMKIARLEVVIVVKKFFQ